MQAALPYVDDFLPVHNLNSLEALARHLNNLSPQRTLGPRYRPAEPSTPETPSQPPEPPEIDPSRAPTFRHPMWGRHP